uniref:Ig-like domain-containing protein n=1 Tax=Labrus bergylta TaxID=56723 RepID=A0A3Q3ELV2_9LABR
KDFYNVLQPEGDVTATEGEAVTLGCQYNSSSSNEYLYWYKQDGNNSPKFILSRFKIGEGKTIKEFEERFSSTLDSTLRSVPLKIQKLQLTDSAVYYCALRPTRTNVTLNVEHQRVPPVGSNLVVEMELWLWIILAALLFGEIKRKTHFNESIY